MDNVIWRAYTLGDLFNFDSSNQLSANKKALNVSDKKDNQYCIALITQSEQNNGISGYLENTGEVKQKKMNGYLTYSMHFGLCFYHDYDFALMDTHGSVFRLIPTNIKFLNILQLHKFVNSFLGILITKICSNDIYNYSWLPNSTRVGREIILLPCIEVSADAEYIWEENGKYYTLAVDYIKKLMDEAKELREQKTIRLYEAERAKYEAGYKKEKSVLVWKGFKLGDLLERSTKLALGANQKDLNLVDEKDNSHSIALISASRTGSGRVGYVETSLVEPTIVSINKLTFDDQWGFTFFQQEPFVITGGHNAILEINDSKLKALLDKNLYCYSFLSLIINNITVKSEIFGYGYKINNKLDREIILLPCIEVSADADYIWEENGKYYTLAVDYIKKLMDEAKELREQKTIRLYEAERAKYEAGYKKEKSVLVWKGFKLGDLFEESTEHYLEKSKKNYNISDVKTDDYPVAVCAASKYNNGIVGYIAEVDDVPMKKRKGYITKGGFGHFFYQSDWFIKPGGSWGMLNIVKIKDNKLKALCDSEINLYHFLCRILTNIFEPMCSFGYAVPFDREIILLPCIEVSADVDYIWEENGKYYTLAVDYISYIYLSGRVNYNDKLIKNYTYQY